MNQNLEKIFEWNQPLPKSVDGPLFYTWQIVFKNKNQVISVTIFTSNKVVDVNSIILLIKYCWALLGNLANEQILFKKLI